MNPVIPQFEQPKKVEANIETQELTIEQKKVLAQVWTKMVVDVADTPENIGEMTPSEIKKWLFDSTMKDIYKLADELGLRIDEELVAKIQKTESTDEKSVLELEYIKNVHAQIDNIVKNFDRLTSKSTKWDSWPKKMRETKEFNCVGATLLGISLLERGGIKSYLGNPYNHVLNIVKLSNGEWWYVDFMNGKKNIFKIDPIEIEIAGVNVLKIKQSNVDYKLIPIFENSESAGSILGNFSYLINNANDQKIPDDDIEKKEAKKYIEKFNQDIQNADFSIFHESLYSKFIEIDETDEMQKEISRIKILRDFEKSIQDYSKTLSKEQEKKLVEEMKSNKEHIDNLFRKEDLSILQKCGPELKKVLELFLGSLKNIKEKQPEIHQEVVDKIIERIKYL